MSLHDLSLKTVAIILIAAGVIIVFAISGFQARNLFAPSVTEDAQVSIENEQDGSCIVEGSDRVPRTISNCPYNLGSLLQKNVHKQNSRYWKSSIASNKKYSIT